VGRLVAGASGGIQFHRSFPGGFVVRVALDGLLPAHPYILTLNGNPKLAGNANLIDPVPGGGSERYFDFQTVTTDARGSYLAAFAIALPRAVRRAFLRQGHRRFQIVLYHDFFPFGVE